MSYRAYAIIANDQADSSGSNNWPQSGLDGYPSLRVRAYFWVFGSVEFSNGSYEGSRHSVYYDVDVLHDNLSDIKDALEGTIHAWFVASELGSISKIVWLR